MLLVTIALDVNGGFLALLDEFIRDLKNRIIFFLYLIEKRV